MARGQGRLRTLATARKRDPAAAVGDGGRVLAHRLRHHLRAAGLRVRPRASIAFTGRSLGAEERAGRGVSRAPVHVGFAGCLRVALRFSGGILDRAGHYPGQPVAGTLAGATT